MRLIPLFFLLIACGGDPAPAPAPAETPKAAPAAPKAEPAPAKAKAKAKADAEPKADVDTTPGDAAAGETVYKTYCVACHQADGTGMNGMLAGNFVADKERLAKSDAELLASIRDGVTGKIGTMPPWGGTLSDDEMRNVLAYVRATYGQ